MTRPPGQLAVDFDALLEARAARVAGGSPPRPVGGSRLGELTRQLLASDEGARLLADRGPRLAAAGLFQGTAWDDPARLLPPLVKGSLLSPASWVQEALSEMRMLALALGQVDSERITAAGAQRFLEEALVLNLDLLQMGASEEHRLAGGQVLAAARRVMAVVSERLPLHGLREVLLEEVEVVCHQRRILSANAVDMIQRAARYASQEDEVGRRLQRYVDAIQGPSPLAREHHDAPGFAAALDALDLPGLEREAELFGRALTATGLASPQHATLLRVLLQVGSPRLLARALGLGLVGQAELARHQELVEELVRVALEPGCAPGVAGLAGTLERGVLSHPEVAAGLRNLLRGQPSPPAAERLVGCRPHLDQPAAPRALLVAGALGVLGLPLGVAQGDNPTCQSARGISLWSQVAPGYLLELLLQAALDDAVRIRFRGVELCSRDLPHGAGEVDLRVDPVSAVLVPHLDRLYQAMLQQVADQPGDPHRWVNWGFYGPWVPTGFSCVVPETPGPVDFEGFVRAFLAAHHPQVARVEPIHPRPLGLVVTSAHGAFLGLHAITLQRVARDAQGAWRAYIFNPNADGRQDWGQGIKTETSGNGERAGESSLLLDQLASRVYAFHHHPHELGDPQAVPAEDALQAAAWARESWGRTFPTPAAGARPAAAALPVSEPPTPPGEAAPEEPPAAASGEAVDSEA